MAKLRIDERHELHDIDPMIYGQFIEHFGRLVYGGIYDPESPLADGDGFRRDVIDALRRLRRPVMRWPGGCFASVYHWKDGVGRAREPVYDKAWCVEESNRFGTDEFMRLCGAIGAEPYICTNAGTGTPEEMADWVEYCNEPSLGRWARARARNGHPSPYGVKLWSIGNENYTGGEIGAKTPGEWGRFVRESAKMMRRVDPSIQLLAAAVPDLDWNLSLLREAGDLIDWISIHGYFDPAWETNALSGYARTLRAVGQFEDSILKTRGILAALGLEGRIRIAFDEWNLRGWYHPGIVDFSHLAADHARAAKRREANEDNAQYTMADAVFCAGFLNLCMRHGDSVRMANFSPTVCGRGAIGVNDGGIVLRPTYHVFELYRNLLGDRLVASYIADGPRCDADGVAVDALDAVALKRDGALTVAVVNRDPERPISLEIETAGVHGTMRQRVLNGESADSYNDFDAAQVGVAVRDAPFGDILLEPHSVNVIELGQ